MITPTNVWSLIPFYYNLHACYIVVALSVLNTRLSKTQLPVFPLLRLTYSQEPDAIYISVTHLFLGGLLKPSEWRMPSVAKLTKKEKENLYFPYMSPRFVYVIFHVSTRHNKERKWYSIWYWLTGVVILFLS